MEAQAQSWSGGFAAGRETGEIAELSAQSVLSQLPLPVPCTSEVGSTLPRVIPPPRCRDARGKLWKALHGFDAVAATATQQLVVALLADTIWPETHEDASAA